MLSLFHLIIKHCELYHVCVGCVQLKVHTRLSMNGNAFVMLYINSCISLLLVVKVNSHGTNVVVQTYKYV